MYSIVDDDDVCSMHTHTHVARHGTAIQMRASEELIAAPSRRGTIKGNRRAVKRTMQHLRALKGIKKIPANEITSNRLKRASSIPNETHRALN